ncbi:MAG: alkaline phosphatase D family protein [Deltaproteobacteria bacterium]|nr:alkaline phosphatase D family protein [Deltaproteobacteria bacterium]
MRKKTPWPLRRRALLRQATALGALAVLPPLTTGCASDDETEPGPPPRTVFLHGVASGDPLTDGVILWSRVTSPDGAAVDVDWEIATDLDFADLVDGGTVTTDGSRDHTVKLDVTGLSSATTYYFRFTALSEVSLVGRTRTLPEGSVDRLRIAFVSCASYCHGYYNAYRHLSRRLDIDLTVHLGDYIYEYANDEYGSFRQADPPHKCVTLEDYRRRYAHQRADTDLQAVHQQLPMIAIWDDHETANNSWSGGADAHYPADGDWEDRKAAGLKAYLEWLPIREQADGRLQRSFAIGDLVHLIMVDSRIWGRDEQAVDGDDPILADDTRSILGADQEAWLHDELSAATGRWKLLGQGVMMGQLPQFLNTDAWDGYPFSRQRLFDHLRAESINDLVVLTGDIHSSWGQELTDDPFDAAYDPDTGAGAVGVELVGPGITSPGFPEALGSTADALVVDNPHLKYAELVSRGYVVMDIDHDRLQAAYYHMVSIEERGAAEILGGVVETATGSHHLVVVDEAVAPPTDVPPGAPVE